MKKRNLACSCIVILVVFCCLVGCGRTGGYTQSSAEGSPETAETIKNSNEAVNPTLRLPQTDSDYFELFCQNCDVEANDAFSCTNGARFSLVCAQPVTEADIQVTTSWNGHFFIALMDENPPEPTEQFREDLFLLYQGVTPEEIGKFNHRNLSEQRTTEINQLLQQFQPVRSKIQPLYLYTLSFLPVMAEEYSIPDLTVTIFGKSKTYTLDRLAFVHEEQPFMSSMTEPALELESFLSDGMMLLPDADGNSMYPSVEMTALEGVTITGVRFYQEPLITVTSCELVITDNFGNTVSTQWDGASDVVLEKGERLSMKLSVYDPATAGKLWQNLSRYLIVDYRSAEGAEYAVSSSFFFFNRLGNPYEYLAAEDGFDIAGYRALFQGN